jgi:hypothetical protein
MQIDPEDFKRHYALLSDEALLEIDRDELVEAARPYYDAELTERKLEPPDSDGEVRRNSTLMEDVAEDGQQLVATFLSLDEANFARGLLQSADIAGSFENEHGAPWAGIGTVRLVVPTAAYDRACEILESEISDEDLIAQAEAEDSEDNESS